jgi:Flp pilus assembly protein TadG
MRRIDKSSDRGAALVEFGLLLPVFLGLFLGVVTTGLALFARLQMTTAVQEAARVVYTGGTESQATTAANNAAAGTVTYEPAGWSPCGSAAAPPNQTVTVRMTRPDMPIRFLIGNIDVTMQAQAATRCP